MVVIGIISVVFVFYTAYSTTKQAVDELSNSLNDCVCECNY